MQSNELPREGIDAKARRTRTPRSVAGRRRPLTRGQPAERFAKADAGEESSRFVKGMEGTQFFNKNTIRGQWRP